VNSLLTALGVMLASSSAPAPAAKTWEQAVLASNPSSFWRFNEASVPVAYADAKGVSALNRVGTGATVGKGLHPSTGRALVLGNPTTYLTAADSASFRRTGDYAFVFCFVPSTLPTTGASHILACVMDTDATDAVIWIGLQNNGGAMRVRLLHEYLSGANGFEQRYFDFPFVAGVAYDLVVSRDTLAKTYTVWVNGELVGTQSYTNNPTPGGGTTATLRIGSELGVAGGTSASTFQGRFDEIAFYDRKLTASDVALLRVGLLYGMEAQTDDFSADTRSLYTSTGNTLATWTVSGGKMIATDGIQAKLLRNGLFSDRISCKMTRADDAGLVLRYQDANNYYVLVITDASSSSVNPNSVLMYKKVGGSYTLIGPRAIIDFVRGVESKFEFIAIGSRLIVKHNDAVVMQVTDTSLPGTGLAGLRNNQSASPCIAEYTEFMWHAVDPFFDNVVFLCHMDGTTLVDQAGHAITAFGGAGITDVDPKFGTGCTDFNAEADRYVESGSVDYNFSASQSFTIEFWRKAGARTAQENYMECNGARGTNPSSRWQLYHANGSDAPTFWTSGTSNLLTQSINLPRDGQYHHEAWSRNTNTLRGFVDGALGGTNSSAGPQLDQSNLRWGTFENVTPADQTYDEIRITKGVSRYDAAFARPSIPFPNGAFA